jgi:hypothetical protein
MPENMYGAAEDDTSAGGSEMEQNKSGDRADEMEDQSTLVPKSMFPEEPEPGKKCTFEVVHVYEDEVEIRYAKEDKTKPKSEMDNTDEAIDKMASAGGNPGGGSPAGEGSAQY